MKSHQKFNRPSGLTYRRPGRRARFQLGEHEPPYYGKVVRNIYAKPNLTRPTLCEVVTTSGLRFILPSERVQVYL